MDNTSVSFSSSQKCLIYAAAFATIIYKQSWKDVSRKNLAYLNYICGAGELLGLNQRMVQHYIQTLAYRCGSGFTEICNVHIFFLLSLFLFLLFAFNPLLLKRCTSRYFYMHFFLFLNLC